MYRDEICKCHSTSVFLFLSVYNSFILFFELKEFREDQMGKMNEFQGKHFCVLSRNSFICTSLASGTV